MLAPKPESWLRVLPEGLYCEPGGFFIDPVRHVDRAVVTHGHADHARPNNRHVLATRETLAIMRARYGEAAGGNLQPLSYGEPMTLGEVSLRLVPAGHVLGSAQAVMEYRGCRVVVSGDYKRGVDPTCAAFEVVPCDLFVTEATFGLPVFRHPDAREEIGRLLHSIEVFPERAHVIGAYALGKCQRLIALLRQAGWDRPIYLHGALADRWARRLPDPVNALASGWMRVRQRARQRGVELPLVISDHADWDELLQTLDDVGA
ncbi:MAG TPA: DNA ligase-associated DEXH box helicase, partial [Alphaproteobacteria bacterium]|nr:DNA ligase-associated DEXH box helicase [Alphaproteobacteria bacterium]